MKEEATARRIRLTLPQAHWGDQADSHTTNYHGDHHSKPARIRDLRVIRGLFPERERLFRYTRGGLTELYDYGRTIGIDVNKNRLGGWHGHGVVSVTMHWTLDGALTFGAATALGRFAVPHPGRSSATRSHAWSGEKHA